MIESGSIAALSSQLEVSLSRARQIAKELTQKQGCSGGSWYEDYFAQLCEAAGIVGYYRQFHLGPFRLDFCFPRERIAVEINGIYHQARKGQHRDRQLRDLCQQLGICLLEITTDQLDQSPEGTLNEFLNVFGREKFR